MQRLQISQEQAPTRQWKHNLFSLPFSFPSLFSPIPSCHMANLLTASAGHLDINGPEFLCSGAKELLCSCDLLLIHQRIPGCPVTKPNLLLFPANVFYWDCSADLGSVLKGLSSLWLPQTWHVALFYSWCECFFNPCKLLGLGFCLFVFCVDFGLVLGVFFFTLGFLFGVFLWLLEGLFYLCGCVVCLVGLFVLFLFQVGLFCCYYFGKLFVRSFWGCFGIAFPCL